MSFIQITLLAFIQGMAELLPVSSSAHVIVAEKLMGIDPSAPEMTFLLVMLHTGTMFAVLFYFRKRWQSLLRHQGPQGDRRSFIKNLVIATGVTGVLGLALKKIIEKTLLADVPHAELEHLFGNLRLISASLFTVGVIIFVAGKFSDRAHRLGLPSSNTLSVKQAASIGAIQGLCLPFRGFSRSGATISLGLILGVTQKLAEEFSFALAVILTPPVVARELLRLLKAHALTGHTLSQILMPGLFGMCLSFLAGLLALRWVSSWIDQGRWKWFSYYCFFASAAVYFVHSQGI